MEGNPRNRARRPRRATASILTAVAFIGTLFVVAAPVQAQEQTVMTPDLSTICPPDGDCWEAVGSTCAGVGTVADMIVGALTLERRVPMTSTITKAYGTADWTRERACMMGGSAYDSYGSYTLSTRSWVSINLNPYSDERAPVRATAGTTGPVDILIGVGR